MSQLDPDRLFPEGGRSRGLARALYDSVKSLPLVCPHGHTEPRWFAQDEAFPDPARLFVTPDHYIFRMLFSQGVALEALGVPRADGGESETDGRKIWRVLAANWHLFRGTPSRLWLEQAFEDLFGITDRLSPGTADAIYDRIAECLAEPAFRPRALYARFGIEVIATTDGALDDLRWHEAIRGSDWTGRVVPTYRPDAVIDPDGPGFAANLDALGDLTGEDTGTWAGYLAAHRSRRAAFKALGATASDHGHPTARTADLSQGDASRLFEKLRSGRGDAVEAEGFRAQMLTEMARMSVEDGLVMQLHPGSFRNHSVQIHARFGRDKGFDIPTRTDYVQALKPLLDAFGTDTRVALVLFGLDESAYSRELAPLAGAYPALRLGPAWWFFDSPEGMRRFRELTTETAGFYNTVGFNDDTRAFCSIPARHDVARRVDCAYIATLTATGRLAEDEAFEVVQDLAYHLVKKAYRL